MPLKLPGGCFGRCLADLIYLLMNYQLQSVRVCVCVCVCVCVASACTHQVLIVSVQKKKHIKPQVDGLLASI